VRQAQQRHAPPDDPALVEAELQMSEAYHDMIGRNPQPLSLRSASAEMARMYEARGKSDNAAEYRARANPTTATATTTAPSH
jgi:hypothetical protein